MSSNFDSNVGLTEAQLKAIQQRVLLAEKEKLHMDVAQGINNEIEKIIKEEVN
jgi:hypothetical protein